jgi:hypothetical protein
MNSEYEARVKSFANNVTEIRSATGATASTLMFALMSVMLSKGKITDRDLEVMFDVEKGQASSTMRSYFQQNYGDPDFEINNEEELADAEKYLIGFLDEVKETVRLTAEQLMSPRRKKSLEEKRNATPGTKS